MPKNPYSMYERVRRTTSSGRELEAAVLEKAALRLRKCQQNWKPQGFDRELDEALRFNKKIWEIFQSDWQHAGERLPRELRENLLSLSVFVQRTTLTIMAGPEAAKLDSLIQINENLASGLRQAPVPTPEASVPAPKG